MSDEQLALWRKGLENADNICALLGIPLASEFVIDPPVGLFKATPVSRCCGAELINFQSGDMIGICSRCRDWAPVEESE